MRSNHIRLNKFKLEATTFLTNTGIEAAKRAGMYVIGLLTTHNKSELQNANRTAEGFEELLTKGKPIASQI